MTTSKAWKGTTFGTKWMHEKLILMLRHTPVQLFYAFTALCVVPICLITGKSSHIIYRYLRKQQGFTPMKAAWKTYINHCLFSQVVIDKFAMYAGRKFKVDVVGYEHYKRLERIPDKGFIQLSAHIGNYEIAGYTLRAIHKRFNALVFGSEKESVMLERNKMLERDNIRLIPIRNDMSHLFQINESLSQNECISMPADRLFGSPRYIELMFLGSKAKFPAGAFNVAAMRQLDVLAVNVMKTSVTGYTIYVTPLHYDKEAPRRESIQQLAETYKTELEKLLRTYPCQWYNFFEFWT